jgi:putative transposase
MSKKYSSATKDKEWEIIEKVINKRKGLQGRPPPKDARHLWDAIFYITKNGCFWRDLPKDFGPWKRVFNYFNRLKHRGVIEELMNTTRTEVRLQLGKESSPSMGIIDSQSVKTRSFKKSRERI